jgi:Mce-associated membrane protein
MPETTESVEPATGARRARNPLTLLALVLVVAAVLSAGWFGWSWYRAAHDDALAYSQARDEALRVGEQAIQNLNTLDYRKAQQGIRIWEDSTTGDLHDQLVSGSAAFLGQIAQAKTVTTAKVLDGAVTELDERAGKASVIVAVDITVTPTTGQPTDKRERLSGQLTRTGSGWKLSAVGQVPVSAS